MKRIAFDPKGNNEVARQQEPRPLQCTADGCAWKGSAAIGSGLFFCIGHQGIEDARDWPGITRRTAEFQWLADFIAEIQRGINFPKQGASWHRSAIDFFTGSDWPWLAPNEREKKAPELYVLRLLAEARALVQGKERPQAFVPHAQSEDWKRAQRPKFSVAVE